MKKIKTHLRIFTLLIVLMVGSMGIAYAQWDGTGTEEDPFLIKTVDDLALLSSNISSANGVHYEGEHFRLENDLDLNVEPWNTGEGWAPIGLNTTRYFGGHFDGNGHVVRNLYMNVEKTGFYDQYFGGLFGAITGGSVKDLGLENIDVTTDLDNYMYIHLGGMIGRIQGHVSVSNCYTTGKINATATGAYFNMVGGLVGYALGSGNNHVTLARCYSTCTMTGIGKTNSPLNIGGLIGIPDTGTIEDCYATGDVTGEVSSQAYATLNVGGLLGSQNFEGRIQRSYATGKVSATGGADMQGNLINYAGGVIGWIGADLVRMCWINSCVAANGSVDGLSAGRISGGYSSLDWLEREQNYAIGDMLVNDAIVEDDISDDSNQGANADWEELFSESFYKSTLAWDVVNVWNVWDGKGLPYLAWQSAPLFVEIASDIALRGTFKNLPARIEVYGEDGMKIEGSVELSEASWSFIPVAELEIGTRLTILNYEEGKPASYPVNTIVDQIGVAEVSLNKTELTLIEEESEILIATLLPEEASNKNVTWKSDDELIATADADGKVTGVAAGTTVVTVTTEDGGKTATCNVTVLSKTIPVDGISLNKTSLEMAIEATEQLTFTITPEDATNKNVTWSSNNEAIATVTDGLVVAVAAGTASITVTTEDGGITDECIVNVESVNIDLVSERGLNIYPNPVIDFITIDSEAIVEHLFVYNNTGKLILQTQPASNRISMAEVPSGIYFIRIVTEKEDVVMKIVKK